MKNYIILFVAVCLSACGRMSTKDVDAPTNPTIDVVKGDDRIITNVSSLVTIRPTGSSPIFNTSLPTFQDIASVIAPTSMSSTGDVQATSVALKDNYTYISYNMAGEEVFGAIDIINVTNPASPVIEYTYSSSEVEFSDLRIKGNYLYLVGYRKETPQNSAGAILLILDVTSKISPIIKSIVSVPGIYATSMDLLDNKILVNTGSTGGLYKYDISNPEVPSLIWSQSRSNGLYAKTGYFFDYSNFGVGQTKLELIGQTVSGLPTIPNSSLIITSSESEAPSRFTRQNSLVYLNNAKSAKLHVIDISQSLLGVTTELSTLGLTGTANGVSHDQQRLYLSQGEKGVQVVDVANPASPVMLGTFDFNGDHGSANNLWIEKTSSAKLFFLADGRQGIRILRENAPTPVQSARISFYARGMDYQGQATVAVKVNGVVFTTVNLVGTQFQIYNVDYTRLLTANDTVDLVFSNDLYEAAWNKDRNAMVAYLKVNGNHCYIKALAPDIDDLGLFKPLHTLSASQNSCNTTIGTTFCTPGVDKFPQESCVLTGNRQGKLVCDSLGQSYTCVDTGACIPGCAQHNGGCNPVICTPNTQKQDCSDSVSIREKTCNSAGTEFGDCTFVSCKPGKVLVNGQCVPQTCSPNTPSSCSVANGTGEKICNAQGTDYGSCTPKTCNSGFVLQNGQCVPQTCTPNSTRSCSFLLFQGTQTCNAQGTDWGACNPGNTCIEGHHLFCGICTPNACTPNSTTSCSVTNGTGTKTCDSIGSGYGSCVVTTCNPGFYQSGNQCLPNTCTPNSSTQCVNNHLIGTKTCNSQGSAYGTCNPGNTCEAGYYYSNGQCLPEICTPNSTASCSGTNGTGNKTCSANGSSWGTCVINQCNAGYTLVNGQCVVQTCTPNSSTQCINNHLVGTKTCSSNGLTWGTCNTGTTCESGYYYSNGQCLPQACTPNATVSCSDGCLTGTKTCNSTGSAYGSCVPQTCHPGSTLVNGQCVPQLCTPNSTSSCSVSNGTGSKTCSSNGMSWGSCVLTTCNAGFYNNGGTCVPQTCTPNSSTQCINNHLIGTKTCNSTGSSYGSCNPGTTCEAGYYYSNGQCVVQACTPNATTSCPATNGSGVKTCNSTGSAYGSCVTNTCNSGFYLSNGSCVPNLCTPSTTQSCTYNHYVGTQTCSANGSSWGTCLTGNTCEAGYYNNGTSCVPQTCTPGAASACSGTNGTGVKICNAQGSGFGSCSITQCNSGYAKIATAGTSWNFCSNEYENCDFKGTVTVQYGKNSTFISKSITNGTYCGNEVFTDPLVNVVKECQIKGSISCIKQTCTPNAEVACSEGHGSGKKKCDAFGTGYGSCVITSCNTGCHHNGSACTPNVCNPNSTASCSVTNGTGVKTCNSKGSAYGSCQIVSCKKGYSLYKGSCTLDKDCH